MTISGCPEMGLHGVIIGIRIWLATQLIDFIWTIDGQNADQFV